jgi:hypothetical protein
MKKSILLPFLFFTIGLSGFSQNRKITHFSLAESIRINFSYDSLFNLSCINTPPGIYAVWFKVNKKGQFVDFNFSSDSLSDLKEFFIKAIKKSRSTFSNRELKKIRNRILYQTIFFNNILSCHPWRDKNNSFYKTQPDTSIDLSGNYNREIIQLLGYQIASIEKSIADYIPNAIQKRSVIILPPAIINDINPNRKKQMGFVKDYIHRPRNEEERKKLEEDIKKIIELRNRKPEN